MCGPDPGTSSKIFSTMREKDYSVVAGKIVDTLNDFGITNAEMCRVRELVQKRLREQRLQKEVEEEEKRYAKELWDRKVSCAAYDIKKILFTGGLDSEMKKAVIDKLKTWGMV